MRAGILVITTSMLVVMPAYAEDGKDLPPASVLQASPQNAAAPNVAGAPDGKKGAPPDGTVQERCVDVTAGGERSFGCVNEQLKRKVDSVNPTLNIAPIDARSPDTKTGVVNIPGVTQQYGKNFGKSAVPFRPPPPVFTSPLARH
jgi:hypothetical protein